ncbi:helix-turn-helix domain-containing protein [Paenibacillus sp. sgz500958]|uniref:helix-turn-helix domain-containing protein n=1 Tax=Paenibacillus sp. sgz500958 TaxID=3242475 RepID=UPI0036D24DDC
MNDMNGIMDRKRHCWNERLKKCILDGGYTQESFAHALNKKYSTKFTQKTISRWVNLGDAKNGIKSFPDFENMVQVADFFGVDVGYLTGETDEDSFSLEKACTYMGLNGEAINVIRELTVPENMDSFSGKYRRDTFNKVLSASGFRNFFESLNDLHQTSISPTEDNCVFENLDSEIDYMRNLEYKGKIERYELNETLVILINEIYPNPPRVNLKY